MIGRRVSTSAAFPISVPVPYSQIQVMILLMNGRNMVGKLRHVLCSYPDGERTAETAHSRSYDRYMNLIISNVTERVNRGCNDFLHTYDIRELFQVFPPFEITEDFEV